ncbi:MULTISPECIES: YfjI family protein [unclassified Novosphingobium]|uniref:YfjI family protein n=1 Tax=unclassified Novosphingobium TaxID=2644732 RepID=UPI00135B6A19|nr:MULTISPECIES: YfjI family protein [unclassified Novosphingobium]
MTVEANFADFDPPSTFVPGQPIEFRPSVGDPEDYPLHALPPRLAECIQGLVDIVQIPTSIAAQAVLGACAIVAQTRIEIEMPTGEVIPSSLFLFTVAASGDRKSSCDKRALAPIYRREKEMREGFDARQQQFSVEKAAHDAAVSAAKRGTKNRFQIQQALEDCGSPPVPPALPMLLVEEPTIEGIVKLLDEAYPSIGLFSDEGAQFLGGYSMQDEQQAKTGAMLSQLWDGKPIKRVRGTDVTKILDGRRMSLHLMVQPGVAMKLFGNKALRDQGMMSRMLITFPKSLKGQRLWKEASEKSRDDVAAYQSRLTSLLTGAFSRMDPETRQLEFSTVTLQPDARKLWIAFSDHLEKQQGPDGALAEVSDLASKMAQHALRLAAVISYFQGGEHVVRDGISVDAMNAGIALGQYYLSEAIRLFNAGSIDDDSDNAQALVEFIRKEKLDRVGKRWLSRNCPKPIRAAIVLKRALELLVEQGHLVAIGGGGDFKARGEKHSERTVYTVIYPDDAP